MVRIKQSTAKEFQWARTQDANPEAILSVANIVRDVRSRGDAAIRALTAKYDGVADATATSWSLRVEVDELARAWATIPTDVQVALQEATKRIRMFHETVRPHSVELDGETGERLGMLWRPIRRVGVYAPGGRGAYPSTVLMDVIPAQVAGVERIVLVSPPAQGQDLPHKYVLAAAHLLGITEVYRIGGAQAIAGLAYGTTSIPKVDKIVGPGNLYVALAKRAVMGDVGIDSIAGPSEVFIVADAKASPAYVAADMLAQAEHDVEAGAVCVSTSQALLDAVAEQLEQQLTDLPRRAIAEAALERWGGLVHVDSMAEALDVVNESAPEHVELMLADANVWLPQVTQAGAVFVGYHTPEPVGDYFAGPNHVLPTHGSARYASGLGVHDFLRRMNYVEYHESTLAAHANQIVALARAEDLEGHAAAILMRGAHGSSGLRGSGCERDRTELPVLADVTGPSFRAKVARTTGETSVSLSLNLHGSGQVQLDFPVPFLRHMLHLFAVHGKLDLTVVADGDIDVDDHHLVEDIGLALGQAVYQALGNKRGIRRYGERHTPMDETLARAVIDISGRPAFVLQGNLPSVHVGTFLTELVHEFFKSFANEAKIALHLAILYGDNAHHMVEALFKATGAALQMAVTAHGDEVPSTKGVIG